MISAKKGMNLTLVMAIVVGVFFTSSKALNASAAPQAAQVDVYNMQVQVQDGMIEGEMKVVYRNTSAAPMNEVGFRLDMNMNSIASIDVAWVKDESIVDLPWEHRPMEFGTLKSDKGQLFVRLPKPLPPEKSVTLHLAFKMECAPAISKEMITMQDDPYHSLDAWYPKAMSMVNGEWSIDDDRPSNYLVKLDLPAVYTIASTGKVVSEETIEGRRKVELQADNVRGFSIYATPTWKKHRRQKGDRTVTVFVTDEFKEWGSRILDAAFDTIEFSEL